MTTGWSKDAGYRVFRRFLANVLSQGGSVLLQLLSVPIFFAYWGNSIYGSWLILFTIPSLLSFSDLGLSTSAGNAMIHAVALQRVPEAVRLFQSTLFGITCAGSIIFIVTLGIVTFFPQALISIEGNSEADVATVIVFLAAYSVATQFICLITVGFRSDGRYALGSVLFFATSTVEYLVVMAVVLLGGKCVAVSAALFVVRTLGCVCLSRVLALRVPWLRQGFDDARIATLRSLARQSLAVLALPMAQATTLQGTVLVLGSLLSPGSVSAFVTVRTATRAGVQAVYLLNHALMPEFAAVGARDDAVRCAQLVIVNFLGIAITLAPVAFVLLAFGPVLIGAWTHGHVVPDRSLVVGMVAIMMVNAIWQPTANLLLALNRQESYAYAYVTLSFACLSLAYVLITYHGLEGAVIANFVLDMIMLIIIFYLVFLKQELGEIETKAGFARLKSTVRLRWISSWLYRRYPPANGA